jgi:hypothetical protein
LKQSIPKGIIYIFMLLTEFFRFRSNGRIG